MDRFRKRSSEQKPFSPKLAPLPQYMPHADDCWVCQSGKVGRPKKGLKRKQEPPAATGKETSPSEDPQAGTSLLKTAHMKEPKPSTSTSESATARKELFPVEIEELSQGTDMQKICLDDSIPVARFVDTDLADLFVCKICNAVSCSLICQCLCGHRFCRPCISSWLQKGATCPVCNMVLEDGDVFGLKDDSLGRFQEQRVYCSYKADGCKEVKYLKDLHEHESTCKYKHPRKLFGKPKNPLFTMDRQYVKRKRLKEVINDIEA